MSGESGDNQDLTAADVRRTAMNLLARREYARRELAARLASRGLPGDLIDPVMDELTRENLLSDERFADAFVSARAGRGQGPVRIRIELEQKGVDPGIVERALADAGVDWGDLAEQVRRKRFGPGRPGNFKERARQARFLQYRGFAAEHLGRVLGHED
ncbi:MAG: regulatory protein RecX [Gammaproteobacteria bacterium]